MSKTNGNGEINGNGKHPYRVDPDNPRGAPKGSRNRETHGLVTLQNAVSRRTRRGRSLIDRRNRIGQEALAIQAAYVDDLGGESALTTGQRVVLNLLAQNLYLLGEPDKRINKACGSARSLRTRLREWPCSTPIALRLRTTSSAM